MKLSEVKEVLLGLSTINFKLPDGRSVPEHFHVTEVGLITKHFIDCGGAQRKETVVNFQLWEAADYDHRLAPQKFLQILNISKKVLGDAEGMKFEDLNIEVEYQQDTIGRFDLEFDGKDFILIAKRTACLAEDACGITPAEMPAKVTSSCSPKSGCC
jgi:hypothetical protein